MLQIEAEHIPQNSNFLTGKSLAKAVELSHEAGDWLKAKSFELYFSTKSTSTKRSRYTDVGTFVTFLESSGVEVGKVDFAHHAECWSVVDHNIVATFVWWMVAKGYAIETVNRKLSTIKVFCALAAKAGCIDGAELALIQTIHGYRGAEAARLNEKRVQSRMSEKKEHSVLLTQEQAAQLMDQPETPQGHRDRLLVTLLLEHGMRVSELALLSPKDILPKEMHFYRPKLAGHSQEYGRHILTSSTQMALEKWEVYQEGECLLRSSRKGGSLTQSGMSTRSITDRVRVLGKSVGVERLSAHDCRHYCATIMAHRGYSIRELMDWFGWSSAQTAMRYIEASMKQERYKG